MKESGLTVRGAVASITTRLTPEYGAGEAKAMARIIFENLKGWTPVDLALKASDEVSPFIQDKIDAVVARLLAGEPIQYIFGNARFYGMTFEVSPATLIPRPETEELIDLIVKEQGGRDDLKVLDAGTGSGCIAIALARNLPFSQVTATDLSADALEIARNNAVRLKTKVNFLADDILCPVGAAEGEPYDIIVSNPPYIAEQERASMEPNVLEHEPAMALFVPDDDPLKFYRALTRFALSGGLADGGSLYFEINPIYAADLVEMMKREGFGDVTILRDMYGKERFAVARKELR